MHLIIASPRAFHLRGSWARSPIIDAYFTSSRVLNMHPQSTLIHGVSLYLSAFHGLCDASWLTQWLCLWVQLFFNWLLGDIYILHHTVYCSPQALFLFSSSLCWWGNEWKWPIVKHYGDDRKLSSEFIKALAKDEPDKMPHRLTDQSNSLFLAVAVDSG